MSIMDKWPQQRGSRNLQAGIDRYFEESASTASKIATKLNEHLFEPISTRTIYREFHKSKAKNV